MADFLVDVLGHRAAQPGQSVGQTTPQQHQQRCCMPDVVIGLAKEGLVTPRLTRPLRQSATTGAAINSLRSGEVCSIRCS